MGVWCFVSCFLGVLFSCFFVRFFFVVSWLLSFKVWKIQKAFNVLLRSCSHITKLPFHVLLEEIDPIFKMFKKCWDGPSWVFAACLFQHFQIVGILTFRYFPTYCLSHFFLDHFECLGLNKIKNGWFGESWSRPLGPATIKSWLFGFVNNESKMWIVQNEAE